MNSEWVDTTVGEFCSFKYGKGLPERDRKEGDFPVISSAGVIGTHNCAFTSNPGVVIGRKGTVGSVTYSKIPFWPIDTAYYIEDDTPQRDIRFVYYLLQTLGLESMNSDSAVPGLNRDNAHSLRIRVPSVSLQTSIADYLSRLDDRITLLRETNATLEAIAQALFKSWFVNFDPVLAKIEGRVPEGMDEATAALFPDSFEETELGSVPRGWRVESLDNIANFLNGLALQKFPPESETDWLPVIKIAQLRKGDTVGADRASSSIKPEYIVQNGDVLFSWSGSLEVELWCGGSGALNQHLFKVTSEDFSKWFYFHWTRYHLTNFQHIAEGKATTMGHIQRKHLTEAKVVVPDDSLLSMANSIFEPLLEQLINNAKKAQTLSALRDTLLPRLISGQLRIPEVESLIATATH